jgi:hypothetical protein
MATKNFTVTAAWKLVANAADDPVFISCQTIALVEFATTAADDADPDVRGHILQTGVERDALSPRAIGIDGYLYARVASGSSVVLAVDGSTVGDD